MWPPVVVSAVILFLASTWNNTLAQAQRDSRVKLLLVTADLQRGASRKIKI